MMTLWTGSKELHSTSDDKIGLDEEQKAANFASHVSCSQSIMFVNV